MDYDYALRGPGPGHKQIPPAAQLHKKWNISVNFHGFLGYVSHKILEGQTLKRIDRRTDGQVQMYMPP